MIVEITDYGKIQDKNFVDYSVRGLTSSQMDFLKANLDEETKIDEGVFKTKCCFGFITCRDIIGKGAVYQVVVEG